jgi:hypothetical protein
MSGKMQMNLSHLVGVGAALYAMRRAGRGAPHITRHVLPIRIQNEVQNDVKQTSDDAHRRAGHTGGAFRYRLRSSGG